MNKVGANVGTPDGKPDDGKPDGNPDGNPDGKPDGKPDGDPDAWRDGEPDDAGLGVPAPVPEQRTDVLGPRQQRTDHRNLSLDPRKAVGKKLPGTLRRPHHRAKRMREDVPKKRMGSMLGGVPNMLVGCK